MAQANIDPLIAQVKSNDDVVDSAILWINGSNARIQTAIDASLALGASAAELKPLTDELAVQKTKVDAIAAAIAANTPAAH